MFGSRTSAVVACLVSVVGTCSQVNAGPVAGLSRSLHAAPTDEFIKPRRSVLAPFGFIRFCMNTPSECEARGGDSIIDLTPAKRAEMIDVNLQVNRSIRPVNDDSSAGDDWAVDVQSGDCEDFALTKRRQLIAKGWPVPALRIAVAVTPSGEGHAVLIVKTTEGDLVLDNRKAVIKDWKSTDLRFLKIQSSENPHLWFTV